MANKKTAPKKTTPKTYKPFIGETLAKGLESIGANHSFADCAKIARANGILNYYARPDQDAYLIGKARKGELKRA